MALAVASDEDEDRARVWGLRADGIRSVTDTRLAGSPEAITRGHTQAMEERLERMVGAGVPVDALYLYGRWWQLETWLRELVYLELRARYGVRWVEHLKGPAPSRAERDQANDYMASADAGELLAYADISDLFALIRDQWELFGPVLVPRSRWEGMAELLGELRNRAAHCRRPHRDDVTRLELVLRDLERGAHRFYASYLDTRPVPFKSKDPLAQAWLDRRHEAAARLVEHADDQYDVRFHLGYSMRPWARAPSSDNALSGQPGVLWEARWTMGPHDLQPARLWERLRGYDGVRDLLVHLIQPNAHSLVVTFAAVDDPTAVADAIGNVFDSALTESEPTAITPMSDFKVEHTRWTEGAAHLPRRVQVDTVLALADPDSQFSVFNAR